MSYNVPVQQFNTEATTFLNNSAINYNSRLCGDLSDLPLSTFETGDVNEWLSILNSNLKEAFDRNVTHSHCSLKEWFFTTSVQPESWKCTDQTRYGLRYLEEQSFIGYRRHFVVIRNRANMVVRQAKKSLDPPLPCKNFWSNAKKTRSMWWPRYWSNELDIFYIGTQSIFFIWLLQSYPSLLTSLPFHQKRQ